jgi:hypothetical protein
MGRPGMPVRPDTYIGVSQSLRSCMVAGFGKWAFLPAFFYLVVWRSYVEFMDNRGHVIGDDREFPQSEQSGSLGVGRRISIGHERYRR